MADITPRKAWAPDGRDPAWKSDGVTRRPLIVGPVRHIQLHFSGNPDGFAPGNQFLSQDALTYMRNMFGWAFGAGAKGDEYNFVIAGTTGQIFEWAGGYRAAHCTNWNDNSVGIQLGLDVDDIPTQAMYDALEWLRWRLVRIGLVTLDHYIGGHQEFLGTSPTADWRPKTSNFQTSCPGAFVLAEPKKWKFALTATPVVPVPPPTNIYDPEDSMLFLCTDSPMYPDQGAVFQFDGARFVHVKAGPYWDVLVPAGAAPANPGVALPKIAWASIKDYV